MEERRDRRTLSDRRKKPTPRWSWYTFFGRRTRFRRKTDQEKGGNLDRYSDFTFFMLVLILGLNVLDSFLTMMILDLGGEELNPVVGAFIGLHGDYFWIWRFLIVSITLILLYLHHGFVLIRRVTIGIGLIYTVIVVYQVHLILYH
jgi:hypothetical protein